MDTIINLRQLGEERYRVYTGGLPEGMTADFFYESPTKKVRMYFVKLPLTKPKRRGRIKKKEGEL